MNKEKIFCMNICKIIFDVVNLRLNDCSKKSDTFTKKAIPALKE